jgi:MFS transporter, DHA3 family, macrolide efflux protein
LNNFFKHKFTLCHRIPKGRNKLDNKDKTFKKVELRNTTKIILGRSVSRFGNILFDYANSTWIVNSGINSGLLIAIYQSSATIVGILFSILGGILSDLKNRKKILIISDLISGSLSIFLGVFVNSKFLLGVLIVNIFLSIMSSVAAPAFKAIFKEMVEKKHIGKVNSWLEVSSELTKIITPILSVFIVGYLGIRGALIINGISFIISSIMIALTSEIRIYDSKSSAVTLLSIKSNFSEGFRYIYDRKEVFLLILLATLVNFLIAGYELYLPFSNVAFKNLGQHIYATFLSMAPVGGVLGALISSKLKTQITLFKLIMLSYLCGISLIMITTLYLLTQNLIATCSGVILYNLFETIFNIQFMTYLQLGVEETYLGRVFGILFSMALLLMPIGSFFFENFTNVYLSLNYIIIGLGLIAVTAVIHLFLKRTTESF